MDRSLTGWTHGEDAAKGGQEDSASSGLEENSCGPQSHSWTPTAVCRESSGNFGPGKIRLKGHELQPVMWNVVLTQHEGSRCSLSLKNHIVWHFKEKWHLLSRKEACKDRIPVRYGSDTEARGKVFLSWW